MSAPIHRYKITSGTGSWHQQRAGHFVSSVIILEGTEEELARYLENAFNAGDSVVVENLDLAT